MATRAAPGGARTVDIPPERLARWIDGFHARHPDTVARPVAGGLLLAGADAATALIEPAFPPLRSADAVGLIVHALRDRRVGVLLCRLGGHAAGVFQGRELLESKVGRRQVHARSAAGGWSQQRFARRRAGQVNVAHQAATEDAVRILAPAAGSLEALVLGGDRTMIAAVMSDRRLAALKSLEQDRILDVVDPRLDVLKKSIDAARAARITLR